MAVLYCFDEYTDQGDETFVWQATDIVKQAFKSPSNPRPATEMPIGELFRQFLKRTSSHCSASVVQRLIEAQERSMDAQVQQCVDRKHDVVRNSEEYLVVRLHSSSMLPSYVMMELEIDLPDEVYHHPLLEKLRYWGFILICIDNDIFSYNIERARGQALHNWVTLLALERNTGLQEAVDYLGAIHDTTKADFLEATKSLPSWGEPIDTEIHRYIDGIGNWVRANYEWSFESRRYFDGRGAEVRRTRRLMMLPKVVVAESQEHWAQGPEGVEVPGLETAMNLVPSWGQCLRANSEVNC